MKYLSKFLKFILLTTSLLTTIITLATPISIFGGKIYAENNSMIEYAVLYEAAAYRHDLYYEFGESQGYIATNPKGTGGAHGCKFCSYPSIYGNFYLNDLPTTTEIVFRLEINNKGLNGALRTGSAEVNPDNLIHAWLAIAEGLPSLDEKFGLNIAHESFSINTLISYYHHNNSISKLLAHNDTRFIGFEDILGGGDLDYNDIIFAFRGVNTVPVNLARVNTVVEPNSLLLLLTAIFIILINTLPKDVSNSN
ncbi:MAG: DUF4114 domain-containing protein [Colwellia sp.]|nr:DUF4114 domain-containing protein [Colwellia sp.]